MTSDRNNRNYRLIRATLGLQLDEIVRAFALIGVQVSVDRARRWGRSANAGTGRFTVMQDLEFDQFCEAVSRFCYEERTRDAAAEENNDAEALQRGR